MAVLLCWRQHARLAGDHMVLLCATASSSSFFSPPPLSSGRRLALLHCAAHKHGGLSFILPHKQKRRQFRFCSPMGLPNAKGFSSSSASSIATCANSDLGAHELEENFSSPHRRRHLCYYYSQGLCTLENDPFHLEKFTHDYPELEVDAQKLECVQPQPFRYYLVLDLEGMVEILEFPVVMIDTKTLEVVDRFHRFVRPAKMSDASVDKYIEGKYGRWGLDRVWHDTAIPFTEVLRQFEDWLQSHGLWSPSRGGKMKQAAFVTCGNWDIKTKIPQQCKTSSIPLPDYFREWVNLKDIYLNFYKERAGGMLAMLKGLQIPLSGSHHLGLDDAHNITRVLQRILIDGGAVKVTAKRSKEDPADVKFRFKYRIR